MGGSGPSRGCHVCRKRKVRCDETKPRCLRCAKLGVKCPGYRDQSSLIFRNATRKPPFSSGESLHASSLQNSVSPRGITEGSSTSTSSPSEVDESPSPHAALALPGEFLALSRFFHDFRTIAHVSEATGWLAQVDHLYASEPNGSCLNLAIKAASRLNYAFASHSEGELREARMHHGQSLVALKDIAANPSEMKKDSTLLAVMVLVIYEVFVRISDAERRI